MTGGTITMGGRLRAGLAYGRLRLDRLSLSGVSEMVLKPKPAQAKPVEARAQTWGPRA
jgi:hypothetical protein